MRSLSRFFKRLAGRDRVPAESVLSSESGTELANRTMQGGDVVKGAVAERRENSLGLDLGGQRGWVPASRLGLGSGGVERGPYQVGHVLPVQVLGTNGDGSLDCDLVIKVGDELEGTVAEIRKTSLGVDIKGWRGWVSYKSLGLERNVEEAPYRKGDVLAVRVAGINPGQSFNCEPAIKVGDELPGTIKELRPDSLSLDVEGRRGWITADNLGLRAGEVEAGPYKQGHVLPVQVLGIDRDGVLDCKPVIKVGDVLEGTVAELRESSLGVDIKGWRGWVSHKSLGLERNVEEAPYRKGDVLAIRVAGINPGQSFDCKPAIKVGDELIGTVTEVRGSALRLSVEDQYITLPAGRLGLRDGVVEGGPYKLGDRMIVRVEKIHPDGTPVYAPHIKEGDLLIGKVAEFHSNSLGLDVDGRRVHLSARSLGLSDGEVGNSTHEIGDWMIVRVADVDGHGSLHCERHSSVDLSLGNAVTARIVAASNDGLTVDVDGVPGWIARSDLLLDSDAGVADLFRTGESINAAVRGVDEKNRRILLSVKRLLWDYAASNLHTVVSARVAESVDEDGLKVTVNDLPGLVPSRELFPGHADVTAALLEPGDTVAVFVMVGDRGKNGLNLSLRRAMPSWIGLLKEGAETKGFVVDVDAQSMSLKVSANGITQRISGVDLPPGAVADLESYVVGQAVDVYVQMIDSVAREVALSMRRKATPEELNSYEPGQPVKGILLLADEERGLAIDLEPVVGWVDWAEVPGAQRYPPFWNRRIGHTVFGHVATAEDGSVAVTLKQASIAARDLLTQGDVVVGRVTNYLDSDQGTGVFVGFTPNTVSGLVFSDQIPIEHRDNPRSVYQQGDSVSVEVTRVDRKNSRLRLSIVGAPRQRNKTRFGVGDVVSCVVSEVTEAGLQVTAKGANGFIRREELTCSVGDAPGDQVREGEQLEAVVIDHESSDGMPYLSIRRLAPDWLDRIAELQEGQEVRGVVVASHPESAYVDIGAVTARIRCDEQSLSPDSEMRLKADDEITAVITRIGDGSGDEPPNVGLSMRQADPSYADAISEVDNSIVDGIVAWVEQNGIGVDIGPVTGFVPRNELPVAQGKTLSNVYKPGDTVRVKVSWVDPDKKRAGLSVGRADPLKYGLTHPEFLDGVSVEARCVEIGDRIAKFEIPGNDLRGVMPADEFSLEAGETEVFKVDDTITAFVVGVDKDYTTVRLSLRRAQDGWSAACARIKQGETLQGAVVEVAPRGGVREGGVRVDLGPLTEWVDADEVSLDTDAFPNETYSIGDRVGVYVVDAGNLGEQNPWLELSLRRAMEEWDPHARRISEGSLMTGRVLPGRVLQGRPELLDGVVRIDLGAVNGRVSAQEYDGAAANAYVLTNAGNEVNVVVRRFEISDIRAEAEAEVSIEGYAKRWEELADSLPDDGMIEAEYVGRTGSEVHVDLGSGLLCRMSVSEWAMDAAQDTVKPLDSYSVGDPIDVRITSIIEKEQTITGTLLTQAQREVAELLMGGESSRVEFKPGLRKIQNEQDRDMEQEVLKNIVAFLNTDGGDVLIGVADDGEPLGLDRDAWASIDVAQRFLMDSVEKRIGKYLWKSISTESVPYAGVDLLRVRCKPLDAQTPGELARLDGVAYVRATSAAVALEDEAAEREHCKPRPQDEPERLDLAAIIARGETTRVEFKSTLRVNLHTGENDDRMQQEVIKTIAGFLNANGGTLIIGVTDKGKPVEIDSKPVGIDADKFASEDKMSLHLTDLVDSRIGTNYWTLIDVSFDDYSGVRVLTVHCKKSSSPAYAKESNGKALYVRAATSTRSLEIDQVADYLKERFD